jgi:hypothetical protein
VLLLIRLGRNVNLGRVELLIQRLVSLAQRHQTALSLVCNALHLGELELQRFN